MLLLLFDIYNYSPQICFLPDFNLWGIILFFLLPALKIKSKYYHHGIYEQLLSGMYNRQ